MCKCASIHVALLQVHVNMGIWTPHYIKRNNSYHSLNVILNFFKNIFIQTTNLAISIFNNNNPFTNFIWTTCPVSVCLPSLPACRPKCSHTILLVFGFGSSFGCSAVLIVVNWQVWVIGRIKSREYSCGKYCIMRKIILQYELNTTIQYWRCWILYLDNKFHTLVAINIGIQYLSTLHVVDFISIENLNSVIMMCFA